MRLLIAFVALLLSGCWIGTNLYLPVDARAVVTPGTYRWTTPSGEAGVAKVSIAANGMTSIDVDGDVSLIGLAPLDAQAQTFVSWSTEEDTQFYELAVRQPDASVILYTPSCEGEQAETARTAGAMIERGMLSTCRFASRASLESAMRRIKPSPNQEAIRFIPTWN